MTSVNWMAAVAGGLSVAVSWIWLAPNERGIADSDDIDMADAGG